MTFIIALAILITGGTLVADSSSNQELIVCGWDEVFILDMADREASIPKKIWSWRAEGREDLPEAFWPMFATTDECKPFDEGKKLLITSSSGAVALLDRAGDRILFYARVANAHSADLLPNGRVAVAASHSPDGTGDRLIIFDLAQPDKELWSEELPWAHGAAWDEDRQLLWSLSGHDIRVFELRDWERSAPKLKKVATIRLPERGGHDFYPVPGTPYLGISTRRHCWWFDRDTKEVLLHPVMGEMKGVKSMSQHSESGQIVYVKGEDGHWWSENLYFLEGEDLVHVDSEHFYKARWNVQVR